MRILLIGTQGQVGWELRRTLACLGEVIALDRRTKPLRIDLGDPDSLRRAVAETRPQLIVNAAAYTAVDRAEQESDLAHRINGDAPAILAELAGNHGAGLIHYSTDYVFSGTADKPYREEADPSPQNVYGESKLAGELAVRDAGIPHLILRTSWVYGARGNNFLLTMLRLMREREALTIVDDQRGAPTWCRLIAEATALIITQCLVSGRFDPAERSGIYHMTCSGETSWYQFAEEIGRQAGEAGLLPESRAALSPIGSDGYPAPAKRPLYSILSCEKLHSAFVLRLPDWREGLRLCLEDLRLAGSVS